MRDVTGEQASAAAVCLKKIHGEEASLGKDSIDAAASMAFAENEAVALFPPRIVGIFVQDTTIEDRNDIGYREDRTDVRTL